jgi:DNA polymerase IV (DinB-like DNA polymerase)
MKRIIAHLDMDAFFASVEEVTTKRFLGKPIVVGSPIIDGIGRGVVSTANYKAREYGIHSAMPISVAWKLSQDAKKQGKDEVIFLPVDFELYHKVSHHVEEIIKMHTEIVEQASVDEFYFDLSFIGTYEKAEALCKKIKKEILAKERVTCSVGIGPNKLIAKIAAGMQKPNGLVVVPDDKVQNFLRPLKVRELPGIGPKTEEFLHKKDINFIKDLLVFSREELHTMMGKHGESIYDKARGIDESPIAQFHAAKSIGEQTTFSKNSLEPVFVHGVLQKLAEHVFLTFTKSDFTAFKTITITVRFSDFETKTSSKSFKEGIGKSGKKKFEIEVLRLVLPFLDKRNNPRRKLIRLIGVRVEKLVL